METKLTPNQKRILELLRSAPQERSAQDLYAECHHQRYNMGLATVYRALRVLQLAGKIQSRTLVSGEAVYSLTSESNPHLTCLQCGISVPLENCPIQALKSQLGQVQNFKVYYHTLEFFGLCSPCFEQPRTEQLAKS